MRRITLTDDSGRWFDADKAERFDEETDWNGSNLISRATHSQWDHEALYYTAGKRWICERTSQWSGTLPSYEEITDEEAARWLSINGHEHPSVDEQLEALEIK